MRYAAMMRDTPRTFVGSAVLLLEGPVSAEAAAAVCAEIRQITGIGSCDVEAGSGTVVVTATGAVDRADLVMALDRLGCRVRP